MWKNVHRVYGAGIRTHNLQRYNDAHKDYFLVRNFLARLAQDEDSSSPLGQKLFRSSKGFKKYFLQCTHLWSYLPTSGKAAKKKKRLLPKLCKPKQHFLVWLFLKTTQLLTSLCWKRLKENWRRHKFMMCTYLPTEPAIKTMNLFKQMQRKL